MRKFIFIVGLFLSSQLFAQTGIGTTTPNASAKLDVYATNKGFLPPRVTLTSGTDAATIVSPAEGLLVYNVGSVGLQAGYYYWNGANWATIATATSAGNGVTASDMVKLYGEVYSNATGKIAHANGFSFTVPVSGRYLFDFSSSGYLNQATMTFTFKVRQGTTDIGTDVFSNANNNVHVVYDGKVEVNLQAGVTYNVQVTTTGSRDGGDYDRVFYKQVAGNLPVTGQTVDYVSVTRTTDLTVNTNDVVKFNSINSGNIPYDIATGRFTLTAGKTYKLSASISLSNGNTAVSEASVVWKNAAGDLLPNKAEILSSSHGTNAGGNANVAVIYTPTVNTTVTLNLAYATPNAILWGSFTYANIEQIGSSAMINPWTLSGTNTYNTIGNVGIGNNAPTQALDVTGSGKFSSSIINSGTRSYFGKDGSNMHWFASTDAAETNNLAYGFESNGTSIQSHRWNIGGSERMRINSSGNLGIGTASPLTKLHLLSANNTTLYVESTTADNNGMVILNANTNQNWGNGWHEFLMFQNQGSTIGQVVQTNASTINYATTSDYRLKTDFKSFKGLDLVNKIKTYDYAWKADSSRMYGVKAHELQAVLPYLVSGKKDEVDKAGKVIPQTVDYGKLTPVIIKAIQEQDLTIKNQAIEIQKLNKEKAALEKSILDIQRRLLQLENKKN
jgi:hypothetical protein